MKIQDQNNAARVLDARHDERTRRARQEPGAKTFEDLMRQSEERDAPISSDDEGLLPMEDEPESLGEEFLVFEEAVLEERVMEAEVLEETTSCHDPAVEQIVDRMVEAVHVGQDERARRVVLIDVVVPGMGRLRARLKRTRQGVEVRLRAEAPELTRLLRGQRAEIMDTARARGIEMTKVEIAGRAPGA